MKGMIKYSLGEILLIAFLAVLSNASTWVEIEEFGRGKEAWLSQFLPGLSGIPSHDTFRRVFSLIDTAQMEAATVAFLIENIDAIKTALPKDGEATEVPVARDTLSHMDLKGCIVTFDALHTTRETIAVIAERGGDYLGGLKANTPNLLADCELEFSSLDLMSLKEDKGKYFEQIEKAHGQIETRRYYMTSLSDVSLCAEAIRGHWCVENNLHWHLDHSFSEDENTTMDKRPSIT